MVLGYDCYDEINNLVFKFFLVGWILVSNYLFLFVLIKKLELIIFGFFIGIYCFLFFYLFLLISIRNEIWCYCGVI